MAYPLAADHAQSDVQKAAFDEAFSAPGEPRAQYRELLETLEERDLDALRTSVCERVAERGMAFLTDGEPDPFPLDPVPRVLEAEEWDVLERGLAQRARALNAFLADVYGDKRIVEAGCVPQRVIRAAELCEPDMHGVEVPGGVYAGVAGMDVVRADDGRFAVLEDNLRTPSGAAYAAAAREIVDAELGIEPPARREQPDLAHLLGETLRAAAPDPHGDPSVVLLSDGPGNSAWWEHVELAGMLGIPIVTPNELDVSGGRVRARTGDTPPLDVHVIYRRTDESRLRDDNGQLTALGEMLLDPLRRGTVACVNAFGCGLADDKLVQAYVEDMMRFYLGEEPLLPSVRTYDPWEPSAREEILERIDELVVKPRDGFGGDGVIVCPHASPVDRERAARLVRSEPDSHVAQETISLSTHPTVVDGELVPRHVDLRAFVFSTPAGVRALPGGLTRVALDEGALVVNSSQNGGGKDTWVLDR